MKKVLLLGAVVMALSVVSLPASVSSSNATGWNDSAKTKVKGHSKARRYCESKGHKRGTPAFKECMNLQGIDVN